MTTYSVFPKMSDILQEIEGERFKIEYFDVTEDAVKLMQLRDQINGRTEYLGFEVGRYVRLKDKSTKRTIMSDTAMERRTNYEFISKANGDVLIGGLGLGMVVLAAQDKEDVDSITVIEKYKEIIDLVVPQLPLTDKVKVINADIFEWQPNKKYDIIYFDIWDDYGNGNRQEINRLHRKYGKFIKKENPNHWMGSWREKDSRV